MPNLDVFEDVKDLGPLRETISIVRKTSPSARRFDFHYPVYLNYDSSYGQFGVNIIGDLKYWITVNAAGAHDFEVLMSGTDPVKFFFTRTDGDLNSIDGFFTNNAAGEDCYIDFSPFDDGYGWFAKVRQDSPRNARPVQVEVLPDGRMRGTGIATWTSGQFGSRRSIDSYLLLAKTLASVTRSNVAATIVSGSQRNTVSSEGRIVLGVTAVVRYDPQLSLGENVRWDNKDWTLANIREIGRRKWMVLSLEG